MKRRIIRGDAGGRVAHSVPRAGASAGDLATTLSATVFRTADGSLP